MLLALPWQELEEHLDEGEWPGSRCTVQKSRSQTARLNSILGPRETPALAEHAVVFRQLAGSSSKRLQVTGSLPSLVEAFHLRSRGHCRVLDGSAQWVLRRMPSLLEDSTSDHWGRLPRVHLGQRPWSQSAGSFQSQEENSGKRRFQYCQAVDQ